MGRNIHSSLLPPPQDSLIEGEGIMRTVGKANTESCVLFHQSLTDFLIPFAPHGSQVKCQPSSKAFAKLFVGMGEKRSNVFLNYFTTEIPHIFMLFSNAQIVDFFTSK